ncbi:MAG TPA: hypothetical protein VFB67_06865 [Candidatus Polarisedimenticolaceae bacterium]|nr:hypothetical protein [Candidatus Polarisedimenticolaceae bacterium]
MTDATDERHYVRAVESAWAAARGRGGMLSRRDFELVSAWRRRGIPLSVVLEVLDDRRRRAHTAPASLTRVAAAVDEAWAAVASGRSAPAREARVEEVPHEDRWEDAFARAPEGSALRTLLARVRDSRDERDLDAHLLEAAPAEVRDRAVACTRAALDAYRGRMSADEYRRTFDRAVGDRVRAALGLPPRKVLG